MAYTNINPTQSSHLGVALTPTDGDQTNGNKVPNDGRMKMLLENRHETNSATVTIATTKTVDGLAVADNAITLAAGQIKLVGPFPPELYNQGPGETDEGCLRMTFSGSGAADVFVAPFAG